MFGGTWTTATGVTHIGVVANGTQSEESLFENAVDNVAATLASTGSPVTPFVFDSVPNSYGALTALSNTITSHAEELGAEGVNLSQWGPNPQASKVEIYLSTYSSEIASKLYSEFGASLITVSPVTKIIAASAYTRTSDAPPWSAGDAIWFGNKTTKALQCTGGFFYTGIHSGALYMLTAGHCAGSTVKVYTNYSSAYLMGTTTAQHFGTGTWDITTVRSTGSGTVYGPGTTIYTVKAAQNPTTSTTVDFDGALTTQRTTIPVIAVNQTIQYGTTSFRGIKVKHVFVGYTSSRRVCWQGDSGGPVMQRRPTGGVTAMGVIIAHGFTTNGKTCYAQQITNVLSRVTGTIKTT